MKIKALSLWEPWATLMMFGAKTIETRSWATSYRGPLLICAAKRRRASDLYGSLTTNRALMKGLGFESTATLAAVERRLHYRRESSHEGLDPRRS